MPDFLFSPLFHTFTGIFDICNRTNRNKMKHLSKLLPLLFALFFVACSEPAKESITIYSLSIEPKSAKVEIGNSLQLEVISNPAYEASLFDWSTTNEAVATVSSDGVVTAIGKGSVKIICKWAKDELSAMASVTVYDPADIPDPEPEPEPEPEPDRSQNQNPNRNQSRNRHLN